MPGGLFAMPVGKELFGWKQLTGERKTFVAAANATDGWDQMCEAARTMALFKAHKEVFTTLVHSNLWVHLQVSYPLADITEIRARANKLEVAGKPQYDALVFPGLRLLQASHFAVVNVLDKMTGDEQSKACYAPAIKGAIDAHQPFECHWRDVQYNCSILLKWQNGGYCGWFKQEFRNTANGHVWLLINATTALYYSLD